MARKVTLWLPLLLVVWLCATPAWAQADDKKARELFEQGVALFEQGDHDAARVSFEAAAELVSYPIVLFDLGLCYEALGDPVRAVRTMEKVLSSPGNLKPERLEQARKTLEAQRRKIAKLTLRSTPEGAEVRVGGVLVGRTPIVDLALPAGTTHLELTLDGHSLLRKTQSLEAEKSVELELTLAPSDKKLAHVIVRSQLPAADIVVDGLVVGRTPLAASLGIEAGTHRVELRRPGYLSVAETLVLADGANGEVTLNPAPDAQAAPAVMATLALTVEPGDVSTFVDGARRELRPDGASLAAGLHIVRLERTGYEPLDLRFELPAGQLVHRTVELRPNPELRSQWIAEARTKRVAGGLSIALGGAFAVGGVSILAWNSSGKSALEQERIDRDATVGEFAVCGKAATFEEKGVCKHLTSDLTSREQLSLGLDVGGSIGLAVGIGAVVAGAVLVATARDTTALEQKRPEPWGSLVPLVALGPEALSLGVGGSF